jgi:protein-tyrosine-phosphatase
MKVLMVCTGNLCRSPMAEGLFRHAVSQRDCDIEVSSVGTWAYQGDHATSEAIDVLRERGIDLSGHRSQAMDQRALEEADVIVAMTSVHRKEILKVDRGAEKKIVLMKELVELALEGDLPDSTEARIDRLLGAARPEWRRALDLDDPMGKPVGAYERTADHIEMGIEVLVEALCARKQGAGGSQN